MNPSPITFIIGNDTTNVVFMSTDFDAMMKVFHKEFEQPGLKAIHIKFMHNFKTQDTDQSST